MARLIYGVGYNSGGEHKTSESGKRTKIYSTWKSMLRRCYCPKSLLRNPTYTNCSVDTLFHDFQYFAEWYKNHKYSGLGYELDKDLLVQGNKTYSPDTCCFVPQELNKIINSYDAGRGENPRGVYFRKSKNKYIASMSINGKTHHLGCFDTASQAYAEYKRYKESYVKAKALEWQQRLQKEVFEALLNWRLI